MLYDCGGVASTGRYQHQESLDSGLQVVSSTEDQPEGDLLELPDDYETFLAGIGPHTRRNLRYYRRKAEAEGIRFIPKIDVEEYEQAIEAMREVTDFPHDRYGRHEIGDFSRAHGEPLLMGLHGGDGQIRLDSRSGSV